MFRKKHHRNDKITKCYDSSLLVILSDKTKQYLLQEFETNFGFVQTLFRGYRAGHQSDRALGTSLESCKYAVKPPKKDRKGTEPSDRFTEMYD